MLASLAIDIEALAGVGPKRGQALRQAGICTVADLLRQVPRRYLDRSELFSVIDAPLGREVTLVVSVEALPTYSPSRREGGKRPWRALVADNTGELTCVWFHGGQHLPFAKGDVIALSGVIESYRGIRQISHPEVEVVVGEVGPRLHTSGIVPLYSGTAVLKEAKLQSRGLRRLVSAAIEGFAAGIEETLSPEILQNYDLPDLSEALRDLHFPPSLEAAGRARRRLAFEELLALQRAFLEERMERLNSTPGLSLCSGGQLERALQESLPYRLTGAQERASREIAEDMRRPAPMDRLLHGEVGSGKTIVAALAMASAVDSGYQSVIMAPTELLAEQHFEVLTSQFSSIGVEPVLLVGGHSAAVRTRARSAIYSGEAQIVVGTHALLEDEVSFANLGLVVVDEEHRFGVLQRRELRQKGGDVDLLVMTATPIPRSLALTLYGDLDVSVLDEVPRGRKPVRTVVRSPSGRADLFDYVAQQLAEGHQAFVVYPAIEDGVKSGKKAGLKSATRGFEELSSGPFSDFETALLHGRLSTDEKTRIMAGFKEGSIRALVCTTVVEVGVDVPSATMMVIEHAERFGLAQLHQLRGRVGRGDVPALCVLVPYPVEPGLEEAVKSRMEALCAMTDGFDIANADLKLRGPGELAGTRQAGMPRLFVVDLSADEDLIVAARKEAERHLRLKV